MSNQYDLGFSLNSKNPRLCLRLVNCCEIHICSYNNNNSKTTCKLLYDLVYLK